MSIYVTFDEGPGEQVASNTGWADFCKWASVNDTLRAFCDAGHGPPRAIAEALAEQLDSTPPSVTVAATVAGIRLLLHDNPGAEIAIVTGGFT